MDGIRLGDTVKLVSAPHGLDKEDVCTKIELDIEKPEKSEYTFGMPRETLTDSNASASRKNRREADHMHKWLRETENTFEVNVDALNSQIKLKADKIDLEGYVTMDDFEAVQGWATDFAGVSVSASNVNAGEGDFDSLVCGHLQIGSDTLTKTSLTVVTGIDVITNLEGRVTAVQPITARISYFA